MEKPEPKIISSVSPELTKKITDALQAALTEGLEALNTVTRADADLPHGYDAFFEWIRLDGKDESLTSVTLRLNSVLLKKDGDNWREIPAYCENQGFDTPGMSETDLLEVLHDTVLQILIHFYSTAFRIQKEQLK